MIAATAGAIRRAAVALRERVDRLTGWRRHGTALLLGALATLAMPPFGVVAVLIPSLVGLAWLIAARDIRSAAVAGWWFGFGHLATGLHWVSSAFLVDAQRYGWLAPVAVLSLAGGLALLYAAAAGLARLVGARGVMGVLVLAASWTGFEWVRGWILTGFPWNLMGTVWTAHDAVLQGAALFGVHGLSLMTVAVAAVPSVLGDPGPSDRRAWAAIAVAASLLVAIAIAGAVRLAAVDNNLTTDIVIRVVQPNIPQQLKWRKELRFSHLERLISMSRGAGGTPAPAVVAWPETAVPFLLDTEVNRRLIAAAIAPGGILVTGAVRRSADHASGAWNSLYALDSAARVLAVYDKAHLVPFGEYVPWRDILPLSKLVAGRGDFIPGPGRRTVRLPGLPLFSPLICYEIIFTGRVVDAEDRPAWILNVTNDAWFGDLTGPYQHLAAARLRAVEEGLPVVRAANTGISAIIDAHGRLRDFLDLGATGMVEGHLPLALPPTAYARAGPWPAGGATVFIIVLGAVVARRPRARECAQRTSS